MTTLIEIILFVPALIVGWRVESVGDGHALGKCIGGYKHFAATPSKALALSWRYSRINTDEDRRKVAAAAAKRCRKAAR